jgi:DNA polymerase III alpha subunit (gram-positive type)
MNIKKTIIFFDTETTWILKSDNWEIISNWDLIQLAYRIIKNWEKIDNDLFFNTDTEIEIWSIAVHGLYKKLLEKKSYKKYFDEDIRINLSNIFQNWICVAHNLDFDLSVIEEKNILHSDNLIDTLKIAKILLSEWVLKNSNWKDPEYVNLQYLRYFFELYEIKDSNWNEENTKPHDAFWDVVVLENVFYKLFEIIKNKLNIDNEEVIDIMQEMTKKQYILLDKMRIWKYRWMTFEQVSKIDRWYLEWILKSDFTDDIKYTCKVWLWEIEDEKFFI